MTNQTLINQITAVVKANGNQGITGSNLQGVLVDMVQSLGAFSAFAGMATPSTTPTTSDANVFYLAYEAGQYSGFGVTIDGETYNIIRRTSQGWEAVNTDIKTDEAIASAIVEALTPYAKASEVDENTAKITELEQEVGNIIGTTSELLVEKTAPVGSRQIEFGNLQLRSGDTIHISVSDFVYYANNKIQIYKDAVIGGTLLGTYTSGLDNIEITLNTDVTQIVVFNDGDVESPIMTYKCVMSATIIREGELNEIEERVDNIEEILPTKASSEELNVLKDDIEPLLDKTEVVAERSITMQFNRVYTFESVDLKKGDVVTISLTEITGWLSHEVKVYKDDYSTTANLLATFTDIDNMVFTLTSDVDTLVVFDDGDLETYFKMTVNVVANRITQGEITYLNKRISLYTGNKVSEYVAIGDSITARPGNYVSKIASIFAESYTNLAVSGYDTTTMLNKVNENVDVIASAELITLWGFINNLPPRDFDYTNMYLESVETLIKRIIQINPFAKFIVFGTTNAWDEERTPIYQSIDTVEGHDVRYYNTLTERVCHKYGIKFVNMYDLIPFNEYTTATQITTMPVASADNVGKLYRYNGQLYKITSSTSVVEYSGPCLCEDSVHPTPAGYERIVDVMIPEIAQLMDKDA